MIGNRLMILRVLLIRDFMCMDEIDEISEAWPLIDKKIEKLVDVLFAAKSSVTKLPGEEIKAFHKAVEDLVEGYRQALYELRQMILNLAVENNPSEVAKTRRRLRMDVFICTECQKPVAFMENYVGLDWKTSSQSDVDKEDESGEEDDDDNMDVAADYEYTDDDYEEEVDAEEGEKPYAVFRAVLDDKTGFGRQCECEKQTASEKYYLRVDKLAFKMGIELEEDVEKLLKEK